MLFSAQVGGVQGLERASGPPQVASCPRKAGSVHEIGTRPGSPGCQASSEVDFREADLSWSPETQIITKLIPVSLGQGQLFAFCGSRTSLRIICNVASNCRGS